jgi:hypothetical protein
LPPYSPELKPIEVGFSLVKRFIQKHANLVFQQFPDEVLDIAFRQCTNEKGMAVKLFHHCGYGDVELDFGADDQNE